MCLIGFTKKPSNDGPQLRRAISIRAEGTRLLEKNAIAPSAARLCWSALGFLPSLAFSPRLNKSARLSGSRLLCDSRSPSPFVPPRGRTPRTSLALLSCLSKTRCAPTTAFSCGARSAFKLKEQSYLRNMLSRRQLQGFVRRRDKQTTGTSWNAAGNSGSIATNLFRFPLQLRIQYRFQGRLTAQKRV